MKKNMNLNHKYQKHLKSQHSIIEKGYQKKQLVYQKIMNQILNCLRMVEYHIQIYWLYKNKLNQLNIKKDFNNKVKMKLASILLCQNNLLVEAIVGSIELQNYINQLNHNIYGAIEHLKRLNMKNQLMFAHFNQLSPIYKIKNKALASLITIYIKAFFTIFHQNQAYLSINSIFHIALF